MQVRLCIPAATRDAARHDWRRRRRDGTGADGLGTRRDGGGLAGDRSTREFADRPSMHAHRAGLSLRLQQTIRGRIRSQNNPVEGPEIAKMDRKRARPKQLV